MVLIGRFKALTPGMAREHVLTWGKQRYLDRDEELMGNQGILILPILREREMIPNFIKEWLFTGGDDVIDGLISPPVPRVGMEKPDHSIVSREGQRRWTEVLRAQRRLHQPGSDSKVLRFK